MSHMLEVMTPENTATVSMHNPITGHGQMVCTGNNLSAIGYAIMCFARHQGIAPSMVETSIAYPSSAASVSRETPTLPGNLPPIGSTIHIRTMGKRKPAMPHTIESYYLLSDGTWSFKARDFAGWVHIDSVDTLEG
jgi:hypothetical protein